jgi:hypothetical protein
MDDIIDEIFCRVGDRFPRLLVVAQDGKGKYALLHLRKCLKLCCSYWLLAQKQCWEVYPILIRPSSNDRLRPAYVDTIANVMMPFLHILYFGSSTVTPLGAECIAAASEPGRSRNPHHLSASPS